jgi:hypothetical protein
MSQELLSDQDRDTLENLQKQKQKILDKFPIDQVDSIKELSLILRTIESIETNIYRQANLRAKHIEQNDRENYTKAVSELLRNLSCAVGNQGQTKESSQPNNVLAYTSREVELPDEVVVKDISPAELEIGQLQLNYEEFIQRMEEDEQSGSSGV